MSKIGWCDVTVNWLGGCSKTGPECTFCYAEVMTGRLAAMSNKPARYVGVTTKTGPKGQWNNKVKYDAGALAKFFVKLRGFRAPKRVFANSMSDTWHKDVPPESLVDLAAQIYLYTHELKCNAIRAPSTLMLLTKRADGLLAWQREHFPDGLPSWVLVGATMGTQQSADERAPVLRQVKTRGGRFASVEPMLEHVDMGFDRVEIYAEGGSDQPGGFLHAPDCTGLCEWGCGGDDIEGRIGWVIAGCESIGKRPGRPTTDDQLRDLRDQCAAWSPSPAFFLKQAVRDGRVTPRPMLDGVRHEAFPVPR